MNWRRVILAIAAVLIVIVCIMGTIFISSPYDGEKAATLYIDTDDTTDSIETKMQQAGISTTAFSLLCKMRPYKVRTGRYLIDSNMSGWTVFGKLRNHHQDPVNMTIPSVRTLDRLASTMTRNLMLDSLTVVKALEDTDFVVNLGYTPETLPALFIPNTYQVMWDTSLDNLFDRIIKENQRFWNEERHAKAEALHMSHNEVSTLASIIDEETANNEEKPMVAEMYLNRLEIGMPLQADPTVKVAVGDWSLRRILYEHLRVESPYNTYLHKGLCPGPIRIPSIAGIDAVLNHANHNYLYMCAKEDFSGTHNFAVNYEEHLKNAKRYTDALNKRGIK